MKKILSLLCVGVMVLVGGVTMAGCEEESSEIAFGESSFIEVGFLIDEINLVVNSLEEWDVLGHTSLYQKYDDEFFVSNSLLYVVFPQSTSGSQMHVTNVEKKGKTLTIKANYLEGMQDMISVGVLIVEVSKIDILNVTKVKVKHNEI